MNIYMLTVDRETYLWKAETMSEAVRLAEEKFVATERADHEEGEFDEAAVRELFQNEFLQSCAIVGELENP